MENISSILTYEWDSWIELFNASIRHMIDDPMAFSSELVSGFDIWKKAWTMYTISSSNFIFSILISMNKEYNV